MQANIRLGLYRGKWAVIWLDERGRTQRHSLGTENREEAETKFAAVRYQIHRASRPPEPTIGVIMDGYIANRDAAGKDAPRMRHAKKALAGFMQTRPEHLMPEDVQAHVARRQWAGKSNSTIATELGYMRSAMVWAEKEKWIERAPFVSLPQRAPARERWLTREEAGRLIMAATAPHLKLFIIIALHTAARSEAIFDLGWDRVDFQHERIDFNPKLRLITAKGRAVVPINKPLMAALSVAYKARTSDWVVEYAGGHVRSVKKGFAAACARAGLEGVTPHTLRHTAATWMAMAGVDMVKIARYLGHRDSRTTERVYAKFHPDFLKDAAEALE